MTPIITGPRNGEQATARRAEVSVSLMYSMIAEGRVPHRRVGRQGRRAKIVIREEDLERFLDSIKVNAGSRA